VGRLAIDFVYDVRGILMSAEVSRAGWSTEFDHDGYRVAIRFPQAEDDFDGFHPLSGAIGNPRTFIVGDLANESVHALQVIVHTASTEFEFHVPDDYSGEQLERLHHEFATVQAIAEAAAQAVISFARGDRRQYWLGTTSQPIAQIRARAKDIDTGEELLTHPPVTVGMGGLRDDKDALTAEDLVALEQALQARKAPTDLALELLSEAKFYAWASHRADPVRAVLMAAIATEVRIKGHLHETANDDQRPLVDFALTSPREITITAVDILWDKLLVLVDGRSLKASDRTLFKRLGRLFELRNALVHRGAIPSAQEAQDAVRAADEAFTWLAT
jgi:hypothetical protein